MCLRSVLNNIMSTASKHIANHNKTNSHNLSLTNPHQEPPPSRPPVKTENEFPDLFSCRVETSTSQWSLWQSLSEKLGTYKHLSLFGVTLQMHPSGSESKYPHRACQEQCTCLISTDRPPIKFGTKNKWSQQAQLKLYGHHGTLNLQ
jgi:hypothetical protein